jgi:two-component system sensor histidine kinase EvgS
LELVHKRRPDLILLDLKMPVLDGFETARRLKDDPNDRQIPIVIVTASSLNQADPRFSGIPFDGWLRKPLEGPELWREMSRHLFGVQSEDPSRQTIISSKCDPGVLPNEKTRQQWLELAGHLRNEWLNECHLLRQRSYVTRTESFAERIVHIAREYNQPVLLQWAEELHRQAGSFDIKQMGNTLAQFDALIENIENQACQHPINTPS